MRSTTALSRWVIGVLVLGVLAGCGLTVAAAGAMHPRRFTPIAASAVAPSTTATTPPTTTTTTTPPPVVVTPPPPIVPVDWQRPARRAPPHVAGAALRGRRARARRLEPARRVLSCRRLQPRPERRLDRAERVRESCSAPVRGGPRACAQPPLQNAPRSGAERGSRGCTVGAARVLGREREGRRLRGVGPGPGRDRRERHHLLELPGPVAERSPSGASIGRRWSRAGSPPESVRIAPLQPRDLLSLTAHRGRAER